MKLLNKVLLAIKFEDHARDIIQTGKTLHDRFHSQLILLHILPDRLNKQYIGELVKQSAHINLENLKQQLLKDGMEDVDSIIQYGSVFDKTIDIAEEQEVNVILMGPGNTNATDPNYIGTSVEKVIRKANIPVWIVRKDFTTNFKRILCPVDFSEPSKRALNNAIMLAGNFNAELKVLSIFEPAYSYSPWIKADIEVENEKAYNDFQLQYEEFFKNFDFKGISWQKLLASGSVDEQIVQHVNDHQTDLLTMGTTGRSGLSRILIGSVAEKVIRNVACSVITTKSQNLIDLQFDLKIEEMAKHYNGNNKNSISC